MSVSRRLLVLICLLWSVLAIGPAALAREDGVPVRLVAPRAGAALVAGETAELEWAPLAALDRQVKEWEAFLSLDGGATYPVRITPHLDQDLRRVRWQVPPFPARDARILLRFGDEREETGVEMPARFSIVAPPSGLPDLARKLSLASRSSSRGEPALPGQAGVVAWVEGSRRGGALLQRLADDPDGLAPRFDFPITHTEAVEATPLGPESLDSGLPEHAAAVPPASPRASRARSGVRPDFAADILLLIQRQNE